MRYSGASRQAFCAFLVNQLCFLTMNFGSLALPVRSLAVPVTDCPGASGKLLLSLPPPKEGVLYADSKLLQILPSVGFFHVRREARPSAEFKGMSVKHLSVENGERVPSVERPTFTESLL